MEISDRIKLFRNHLGIDQAEISKFLQIPMRTYGTYERGESKPGSDAILRFVEIGMNANWLLNGEGEMLLGNDNTVIPTTPNQQNSKVDKIDTDFQLLCHYALCDHYGEQYHFQTPATQIEYCGKLANEVSGFLDPSTPSQLTVEDLVNFIKFLIKVGRLPVQFAYES